MLNKNIVFIGMPGSGKTGIGRRVAAYLNRPFIDVDEFIIEKTGKDAAEHLAELGDEKFLDFEEAITKQININRGVIASSGSVPLREGGIKHLRNNAITIWINVPAEVLKKRIEKRLDGATRIVGAQTMTLEEILNWRLNAYKNNHDINFLNNQERSKEEVVKDILNILKKS